MNDSIWKKPKVGSIHGVGGLTFSMKFIISLLFFALNSKVYKTKFINIRSSFLIN
jgi:hypothetical protein